MKFTCVLLMFLFAAAIAADVKINQNPNAFTAPGQIERAARDAIATGNRSNAVSRVNSALSFFSVSSITSCSEVTLTWRTNIHAVVNAKYSESPASQKDDVLLKAIELYENIIALLIAQ